MILYWPAPSVTTDRTFSIKAELAASTVTPGRTAPDVSRATPAMDACADAAAGTRTRHTIASRIPFTARTGFLLRRENGARPDRLRRANLGTPAPGGQYTRSGVSRFRGARAMLRRAYERFIPEGRDLFGRARGERARVGRSNARWRAGPDVRGRSLLAEAAPESLGAWRGGGR